MHYTTCDCDLEPNVHVTLGFASIPWLHAIVLHIALVHGIAIISEYSYILMKSITLATNSHKWCHVPPSQLPQLGQGMYLSLSKVTSLLCLVLLSHK